MFTGIISDTGVIRAIDAERGGKRFFVSTNQNTGDIAIGASIAHSGCCLTVVEKGTGWYAVDVSAETMARTTLGDWEVGATINLERSLRLGDELGGHLVYGHVDAVVRVAEKYADGDSWRFQFDVAAQFGRFVASKGSVAIDGVSLTVNEVEDHGEQTRFGVNIIPHTYTMTGFHTLVPGMRVNFEADMLARYVARLTDTRQT